MTSTPTARVLDRPRRFLAGLIAGVLALGVTGGLPGSPAVAAEGPAPAPTDRTVLADVHTDAAVAPDKERTTVRVTRRPRRLEQRSGVATAAAPDRHHRADH